jgi:hypothetical protein
MEISVKTYQKPRRSSRIAMEIAIRLIGSDMEGKTFSEETKTIVLNRHGSGVVSQYRLTPEQEITIRRLDINKQAARVVGLVGSKAGIHTYGLALLDPNLDFWGIEFPPATEVAKEASRGLFECSGCKGREAVDLNDVEMDVYTINEGIARYCKRCGSSTVWTRASGDLEGDKSVSLESRRTSKPSATPTPMPQPPAPAPKAHPEDRRKYVPAKVKFTACIRCPGSEDDIVAFGWNRTARVEGPGTHSQCELGSPVSWRLRQSHGCPGSCRALVAPWLQRCNDGRPCTR